jgi:Rrf2 family cysteine metabolism transcriptional repressor
MKISTKSRYGIRAIAFLTKENKCCSVREISIKEHIPFEYLEKIFSKLKKADLVSVKRGSQGGYALSRDPKDISVGQVVQALDGKFNPVQCTNGQYICPQSCGCLATKMWHKIQTAFISTLDSISLSSLINDNE